MKLFQTRALIEQMMSTMQELLQAKSVDGGQQKGEFDGSGMRDANEDSDEAGRAPREEGATGARVDATTSTRDTFHADIKSAHDGGGVLSYGVQRQPRVVPPVKKGESIPKVQTRVSIKSKYAAHIWPFRRSVDTSGTSWGSAQTEGSVVTGGFFK